MFEGKQILITGGTGSLGHALTKKLLELGAEKIRIYSRNEHKQIEMESEFHSDANLIHTKLLSHASSYYK